MTTKKLVFMVKMAHYKVVSLSQPISLNAANGHGIFPCNVQYENDDVNITLVVTQLGHHQVQS